MPDGVQRGLGTVVAVAFFVIIFRCAGVDAPPADFGCLGLRTSRVNSQVLFASVLCAV